MSKVSIRSRVSVGLLAAAVLSLTACAQPLEVTVPETLATPGATVAIGETVLVPGKAYERRDDSSYITDAEVGFTVAEVKHEEAAWFDELENPEDFAGYTPVLVSTQYNLPEGSELERPSAAAPYGVLDNGEYTEFLSLEGFKSSTEFCWGASMGSSGADFDLRCTVLLVPEGAELASLEWDGQQASMGVGASEGDPVFPFTQAPLTFELPAGE